MTSQQQQQRKAHLLDLTLGYFGEIGPHSGMSIEQAAEFLQWRAHKYSELEQEWNKPEAKRAREKCLKEHRFFCYEVSYSDPAITGRLMRQQFRDVAWILFYEHGPNAHIECFELACKEYSDSSPVRLVIEETCRETFSGIGNWWA